MHPLLDSDIVECPHSGKVILNASTKSIFDVNGQGVLVQSDMQGAGISGCTYEIAKVPFPCTSVVSVPPSSISTLLDINLQGVVLAEQVSSMTTDKGFPLMLSGGPNAQGSLELES